MKSPTPPEQGRQVPFLRLENVSDGTGSKHTLRKINLELQAGEFHAVIGDHGAGKSTLAHIMAGLVRPHSGSIIFNGRRYSHLTKRDIKKLKIELVCQEAHLIDCLTVTENLLIPDLIRYSIPLFRRRDYRRETREILQGFGFDINPDTLVQELRSSEKLILYILRSAFRDPKLLLLDAVVEKLSARDMEKVLKVLAHLKNKGTSILCLAHGIDEIFTLADKVTILRNGRTILTEPIENVDKINLIRLCYSQLADKPEAEGYREFYQLLRYNEAILQKLPINLVVTDNDNRIKMINDLGRSYFNVEDVDYRELFIDDLFSTSDDKALSFIKDAFEAKQEKKMLAVPIVIGGKKTTADIKTLPIRDGAFLIGNILIVEDISKQEALRQQLIMSDKLASVGILSAGVAHEINNPLEIIYNHLNYLKFNLSIVEMAETVDLIEEELEDIKRIVSNLISFSDRSKVVIEAFDLSELISSILSLIKIDARYRNISVEFTPSEAPVIIEAQKNEIKQVILNLFKNSFEAASDSGRIHIGTDILKRDGRSLARIRFQDNGCGIQDADPNNIFLPFYSSKLGRDGNLGLGLSVSYGIINKYKGEMGVRNLEDTGCEFTILLPTAPDPLSVHVQDIHE